MPSLADIRRQYPQYNDMSDKALADALYSKSYSDMPRAEFDKTIGLKPASPLREATGALQTFYKSIPFADEVNDRVTAFAKAPVEIFTNPKFRGRRPDGSPWTSDAIYKDVLARQQAQSNAQAADFQERRPNATSAVKGLGLAAQVAPALFTGGASAVPAVESAVARRGLMASSARLAKPVVDSAAVAGLGAQAGGYGGDGTLAQRQKAANDTTPAAMALGAAIPPATAAAGWARRVTLDAMKSTGRTGARLANRASGGTILDPRREAALRLGEALKADGLGPQEVQQALATWQQTGASSPALLDLAGENTRALLRSAASKPGGGRNLAVRYANGVAADLQDNAIARTRALTPDARTIPQIEDDVTGRIQAASTVDEVPAGSGGAMVHDALNRRYDTARRGVDQAYDAARAADPQAAHLRSEELPQIAANVRDAVRDFHPDDIPSVARELGHLDTLSTPTVRDLYEMRQRLTAVRMSKPEQARAAGNAIRAIDGEISGAVDRGAVSGDPEVVGLWRNAIGQRREMGRAFEGDDLISRLTGRERHGEGMANAVAPEDASAALLGRNGVSPRPDMVRDLSRIREQLGPESPEWAQLQREAISRVMARDAGQEGFGASWQAFERQNPELAALLAPAGHGEAVAASRGQIADAVADRGAVGVGRSVLNESPDRLAANMEGVGERRPLAQVGAAREIEDQIGRPTEGATGLLNRLSTGTNPGRNLGEIFGDEQAGLYRDAIGRETDRVANARFVSPNTGSQTASRGTDDALFDMPPLTKVGMLKAIIDKVRRGVTLTDAEREALLEIGTTRVGSQADIPSIPLVDGTRRLMTPAQRNRIAKVVAGAEGVREGRDRSSAGAR